YNIKIAIEQEQNKQLITNKAVIELLKKLSIVGKQIVIELLKELSIVGKQIMGSKQSCNQLRNKICAVIVRGGAPQSSFFTCAK
ncbi:18963_t:CDS:1, partial [Gigaspora rosea]